jgi:hypothetical protein
VRLVAAGLLMPTWARLLGVAVPLSNLLAAGLVAYLAWGVTVGEPTGPSVPPTRGSGRTASPGCSAVPIPTRSDDDDGSSLVPSRHVGTHRVRRATAGGLFPFTYYSIECTNVWVEKT